MQWFVVCTRRRFSNGHIPCSNTDQFVARRIRTCFNERSTKIDCPKEDNKEVCPRCQKKVTYRTKGVECEACLNWCCNISESDYAEIAKTVWYCITCKKQQEADRTENGVKNSLRFDDAIVRTVRGDPGLSSRQPINCIQTCSSS